MRNFHLVCTVVKSKVKILQNIWTLLKLFSWARSLCKLYFKRTRLVLTKRPWQRKYSLVLISETCCCWGFFVSSQKKPKITENDPTFGIRTGSKLVLYWKWMHYEWYIIAFPHNGDKSFMKLYLNHTIWRIKYLLKSDESLEISREIAGNKVWNATLKRFWSGTLCFKVVCWHYKYEIIFLKICWQ